MNSNAESRLTKNKTIRAAQATLALLAIANIVVCVVAAKPWTENREDLAVGFLLGMLVWSITPHLGLGAVLLLFGRYRKLALAASVLAILVAAAGLALVWDVFFIHPDAQGGIALLFIPLYQWIAAVVLALAGAISFAVSEARASRGQP